MLTTFIVGSDRRSAQLADLIMMPGPGLFCPRSRALFCPRIARIHSLSGP